MRDAFAAGSDALGGLRERASITKAANVFPECMRDGHQPIADVRISAQQCHA
jgi:hypothetical protein